MTGRMPGRIGAAGAAAASALALVAALALSGCGGAAEDPGSTGTGSGGPSASPSAGVVREPFSVPTDDGDVRVGDVVWAADQRVHVVRSGRSSGSRGPGSVRTGRGVDALVTVDGGVFFLSDRQLWFTDLDAPKAVGLQADRLVVSPDGRYLGLVDLRNGPVDEFGTPRATAVVYDTRSGKRVLASATGMGDPAQDRLGTLYAAAEPQPLGFAGGAFYVRTTDGTYAEPLDGSAPRQVDPATARYATSAGTPVSLTRSGSGSAARYRVDPTGRATAGQLGPDRAYGLYGTVGDEFLPFDVATGASVAASLGASGADHFRLGAWTGAAGFYGLAAERRGPDKVDEVASGVVTCSLTRGRCAEVVPASELPADPDDVVLGDGRSEG